MSEQGGLSGSRVTQEHPAARDPRIFGWVQGEELLETVGRVLSLRMVPGSVLRLHMAVLEFQVYEDLIEERVFAAPAEVVTQVAVNREQVLAVGLDEAAGVCRGRLRGRASHIVQWLFGRSSAVEPVPDRCHLPGKAELLDECECAFLFACVWMSVSEQGDDCRCVAVTGSEVLGKLHLG